jgi:hypothetical protein
MMWPATYQDSESYFKAFIAENQAVTAIDQVEGQPALIITPNTDYY